MCIHTFIQDDVLDVTQVDSPATDVVEGAARGSYEDVYTRLKRFLCIFVVVQ